jgi:lipopolysaccharide export LptBFGC system permease protein LptF
VPLLVIGKYYLFSLPKIFFQYHFLSASVMLTTFLVWGRSAQEGEISALLSGGIRFLRISLSVLAAGILIAIGSFFIEDTAGVWCAEQFQNLEKMYFSYHLGDTKSGVSWTNLSGGWTCHILRFNREAMTGRDVVVHRIREDRIDEIREKYMGGMNHRKNGLLKKDDILSCSLKRRWNKRLCVLHKFLLPLTRHPRPCLLLICPKN